MTDWAHETANAIEGRLRVLGTPERAAQEKRYLKSDLDFIGATVWQIRAEVKATLRSATLDRGNLLALATALWSEPPRALHERRMAAVAALELSADLLTVADLPFLERFLRESRTWALVDALAVHVVGAVLARDAAQAIQILDRWAADDDFWIRRSALLAWLGPLRAGGPLDHFLGYADATLDEKEFFIRKAIGWVLREVGRRRPDEVAAWLAPRTHRASGVTMREATKYLPPPVGEGLMAAYRAGQPAALR